MWSTLTAANSTPARFGALQEASLDFAATVKELFGTYQLPLAVARGTIKVTGKGKYAQPQGRMFNDIFFGGSMATGQINASIDEAGTIPTTPYQVTVANSATFTTDLGVKYTSGTKIGQNLTEVASAPATGQYSYAAGVYTFAAADTGLTVAICYLYTVAATGQTVTVTNQLLGTTPVFTTVLNQRFASEQITFSMNQCTSSKLSFPTKLEDFAYLELDFSCYCDQSNTLGKISIAEQS
jgi:hypothetical protein